MNFSSLALVLQRSLAVFAASLLSANFAAAACSNVQVADLPVQVSGAQAYVPLIVNHQKLLMLLDTGGYLTSLTPDAANRLALPAANHTAMVMKGIGGGFNARVVQAADVTYLGQDVGSLPFAVLPDSDLGDGQTVDGIFGANFLSAYDVELDLAHQRVRFFSHERGCRGSAPAWAANAARLPAVNAGQNLLMIPIQVNGVTLNALVDTGAESTWISHEAAAVAGVTDATMRRDEEVTEQGIGASSARMHRFHDITVGDTTMTSPVLAVGVAPSEAHGAAMVAALDTDAGEHVKVDVILGANFLFKHRIWLGYRDNTVYVENSATQIAALN